VLTARHYPAVVVEAFGAIDTPTGPGRRVGAEAGVAWSLELIERDVAFVSRTPDAGESPTSEAVQLCSDICLETASELYDGGAPHPVWRRWAALAGFGMVLSGRYLEACPWLVLGGEWAGVAALGSRPPGESGTVPQDALWTLATGRPVGTLAPEQADELDQPWFALLDSVPARAFRHAESALRSLADFWIGEDEEWEVYHPGSQPSFEPEVCAAAAVARHHGYVPDLLPADTLRFLEPGLARPEPPPLFPDLTPEPLADRVS
jgi:hypothetical protein